MAEKETGPGTGATTRWPQLVVSGHPSDGGLAPGVLEIPVRGRRKGKKQTNGPHLSVCNPTFDALRPNRK